MKPATERASEKEKTRLPQRGAAFAYRSGAFLAGLGVAGFAFFLYLRTLAPTVLYYEGPDLIDAAMFQAQAYVLGITHPTGYPTYIMLVHLFTHLPLSDPAYLANLVSAIFGAIATFLIFFVGLRLSGRVLAAAVGSLAFAVGNTFWSQAIVAEVYTLNVAFVSIVLLVLLLWRDTRKDRYLLLAAFLMGLSLTHHLTSGILLPAAALFVFLTDRRKLLERRLVLKGAGLFLLGLTPYLYLPIRASMEPPMAEAEPTSLVRFWQFVSGSEFTVFLVTLGPETIVLRLASFWGYLQDEFHVGLLLVAAIGAVTLLLKDRAVSLLLGIPFLGWFAFAVRYEINDYFLYFIPPYLALALLMTMGAGAILDGAERLAARFSLLPRTLAPLLLSMPLLYLAVSDVGKDYPLVDRSQDFEGRRIIEAVAEKTEPNATVLHHRGPLLYMVLVEERRKDLTLVSPWYASEHPIRVWSDPTGSGKARHSVQTTDDTGVTDAKVAAKKGPVYALQGNVKLCDFRNAGFAIIPVETDLLYELVPPGSTPYTSLEDQPSAGSRSDGKPTEYEPAGCGQRTGNPR